MEITSKENSPDERKWRGRCQACRSAIRATETEVLQAIGGSLFTWVTCPVCKVGPYGGVIFQPEKEEPKLSVRDIIWLKKDWSVYIEGSLRNLDVSSHPAGCFVVSSVLADQNDKVVAYNLCIPDFTVWFYQSGPFKGWWTPKVQVLGQVTELHKTNS